MQKFELAHEPTEGPVYGAGGVIVDRVEKGVWREDLAFLPVGSIIAEDGEDPLSKHSDRKWYSGSERIPEYELPVTAYVLRVDWEYPG